MVGTRTANPTSEDSLRGWCGVCVWFGKGVVVPERAQREGGGSLTGDR